MNKVWLLFSQTWEFYNQPDRAFENIFWEKPATEDIQRAIANQVTQISGDLLEKFKVVSEGGISRIWGSDYWIEEFIKP